MGFTEYLQDHGIECDCYHWWEGGEHAFDCAIEQARRDYNEDMQMALSSDEDSVSRGMAHMIDELNAAM